MSGREKEQTWIETELKRAHILCIYGAESSGKTYFLRHWSSKSHGQIQWILHHPFRSFLETLNLTFECEYKTLEALLSSLCGSWSNKLFVWENLHLLPAPILGIFLGHLQIFSGKHILVSRSPLLLPPSFPKLEFFPLENVEKETQFSKNDFLNLDQFDSLEKNLLNALHTIGRPVKQKLLQNFFPLKKEKILQLIDKGLIESQDHGLFLSPAWEKMKISIDLNLEFKEKIWKLISQDTESSVLEKLIHTLALANPKLIQKIIQEYPDLVDALDSYGQKTLNVFLAHTNSKDINPPELILLIVRTHFILGQRDEALKILNGFFHKNFKSWNRGSQKLGVEYAQLLVRQEKFKLSIEFIDQNYAHMDVSGKRLLSIEKAVAYFSSQIKEKYQQGEQILKNLLQELEKSADELSLLPKAQGSFQLARSYYHQNQLDLAKDYFLLASKIFKKLSRPYFAAICDFNLAWIALRSGDFDSLSKLIQDLKKTTSLYGYAILNSGLELIEAKIQRLELQLDQSLSLLESALKRLGHSGPPMVITDILLEKTRVLEQMGLLDLAEETLKEVEKHFVNRTPTFELKAIRIKLQCHHLSLEEARDLWCNLEESINEDFLREQFLLNIGDEVSLPTAFQNLPSLKLAFAVQKLLLALKEYNEDEIWRMITEIETILNRCSTPLLEKAAIHILESALSKDENERETLLSQAKLELTRSPADQGPKGALEAWWQAQGTQARPEDSLKFKKSFLGSREKWQLWWNYLNAKNEGQLFVISKTGRKEAKDVAKLKKGAGLLIFEDRHEIWFNGKLQKQLMGRNQVRKLLALLMESYPSPLKKEELATMLWGESYNPLTHDVRIYTATSRIRDFLPKNIILNTQEGYVINGEYQFRLVKIAGARVNKDRIETLILETLMAFQKNGQNWIGRKELKESTGSSDSTLKRALSKLLSKQWILRTGLGSGVKYSIKNP